MRLLQVIEKLRRYGLRSFALTGGLATEIRLGSARRPWDNVDLVIPSFDALPPTLANGYLFRHIHPKATDGKLLIQLVDADLAIRVDVFLEAGSTLRRSSLVPFGGGTLLVVSLEDLAARAARVAIDLEAGVPVYRKHVDDFLALLEKADPVLAEAAWQDHRKPGQPETFREVAAAIRRLAPIHQDLLIEQAYSQDLEFRCARCENTVGFQLAPATVVHPILGYC